MPQGLGRVVLFEDRIMGEKFIKIGCYILTGLVGIVSLSLVGCARTPSVPLQDQHNLHQVCVHNAFLRKYDCSLQQIQTAAMQGDPDAEYALAYIYYYGLGTSKDQTTALTWMNKAAAQGQPLAIKAMQLIHRAQLPGMGKVQQRTPRSTKVSASTAAVSSTAPANSPRKPRLAAPKKPSLLRAKSSATYAKNAVNRCDKRFGAALPLVVSRLADVARGRWTLQLVSSGSRSGVRAFKRHLSLAGVRIYQAHYQGKPWYIAAYGSFASVRAAHSARACLQRQGASSKDFASAWPKRIDSLQQQVKASQ